MHDYLAFLRKARLVLNEETPYMLLGADTPFWWDRDEFVTEFEGRSQHFSEHVQDLTDFIVIMSYWRDARKVLEETLLKYTKTETYKNYVKENMLSEAWMDGAAFGKWLDEENSRYAVLLKDMGLIKK